MRGRTILMTGGLLLALVGMVAVVQARPTKRLDPTTNTCRVFTLGGIEEGQHLFRSVCKSCHFRGNKVGAHFLYSESLISKAWNRVFAERYPACAKNGSWASLNDEQLRRINDFLYMNSGDSYDPNNAMDCG